MIAVTCAKCRKTLRVKEELAGKRVKCPGCGAGVAVPTPEDDAIEVAPKKVAKVVARRVSEPVDDEDDGDEDESPRRRKGGPKKPHVAFMIVGLVLALGGLVGGAFFIYQIKKSKDDLVDAEDDAAKHRTEWSQVSGFVDRMQGAALENAMQPKRRLDAAEAKIANEIRPRIKRGYVLTSVFFVLFAIGAALRGYHHFAMRTWHAAHHGLGKKKKKKKRRDEDDEDDD